MATSNTTTPRKRTTKTSTTPRTSTTKSRATSAPADDSIVARTGRTIRDRPYTSAAIATGAVTAVAVAAATAAAGAFLYARRDKGFKEASGELATKVKDGFASATETVKEGLASATVTVKDGLASASETAKDLGQRGTAYLKGNGSDAGSETRTQQQIAEEALTLKQTGATTSPVDELAVTEIKTGAIAY